MNLKNFSGALLAFIFSISLTYGSSLPTSVVPDEDGNITIGGSSKTIAVHLAEAMGDSNHTLRADSLRLFSYDEDGALSGFEVSIANLLGYKATEITAHNVSYMPSYEISDGDSTHTISALIFGTKTTMAANLIAQYYAQINDQDDEKEASSSSSTSSKTEKSDWVQFRNNFTNDAERNAKSIKSFLENAAPVSKDDCKKGLKKAKKEVVNFAETGGQKVAKETTNFVKSAKKKIWKKFGF